MRSRHTLVAVAAIPAALLIGTTGCTTDSPTPVTPVTPSPSRDCAPDTKLGVDFVDYKRFIRADNRWHDFSFKVWNPSETVALEGVTVRLHKEASSYPRFIHVQRQDPASGEWRDLAFSNDKDADLSSYSPHGSFDLDPGETLTFHVRLAVDKSFPDLSTSESDGHGSYGVDTERPGDAGACFRKGIGEAFDIEEDDGSNREVAGDLSGKLPPWEKGSSYTPPPTGSSSDLPLIVLAGGAVVAVGAGSAYLVRRRRRPN
ncbi:hypothetical protein KQY30_18540 [Streptomyces sp. GMY02]|uniref:hypothetical protein n=1 Tax=Streptomyces sp. GMY02 TaxID=1333528 RepID=UPI001C2C48FC|nr:hypothetical protein [Streptomyces sp. GMY02]QXE35962.1 hypothetical protein KQY30_18540 [Streptomyces sp. GMY02]